MKQVPVIILGAGGVGQALLQQIVDGRITTATRNQIQFNIVAVADRRSLAWDPLGMCDLHLLNIIEAKQLGLPANPELSPLPGGAEKTAGCVTRVTYLWVHCCYDYLGSMRLSFLACSW